MCIVFVGLDKSVCDMNSLRKVTLTVTIYSSLFSYLSVMVEIT